LNIRNIKIAATALLLFVVILDPFSQQPKIARAQQIDLNWSDPINLSNSGSTSNPSMVVDSRGIIHVIWIDAYDGYKYVESADGKTWSTPKVVNFPFSPADSMPIFVPDPKGAIHVFWRTSKNVLSYAKAASENLGNPAVWAASSIIDSFVYDLDVKLDIDNTLHVSYVRNPVSRDAPSGVYYRQSINGGFSWSTQKILYESQYFRSLTPESAHVRLNLSETETGREVYVAWDDRAIKRIFMTKSLDSGTTWGTPAQIVVPEASLGFETPFNIEIEKFEGKILLMWQVGNPGVRCSQFSQWSEDDGETWSAPTTMINEFIACPQQSTFLLTDQGYTLVLLNIQGDLSLVAWNGLLWSNPRSESGLSFMSNPVTLDSIIFRCQQMVLYNRSLLVVGCDQNGGDIWFASRQLDAAEILFPLPSVWGGSQEINVVPRQNDSLVSISDQENHIHAIWVESIPSATGIVNYRILYSRWNGDVWSKPAPIITDLDGPPGDLSITMDIQQRLFLAWVNKDTGDLMFSWANASRANAPSEWNSPVVLPSRSSLNDSPYILVDASNQLYIAYAVTVNEERGIYLTYSNNLGENWASPVKVFDAAQAGWNSVDNPKLAITEDGRLHILFNQLTVLNGPRSIGLYYSQSSDGGIKWTDPTLVSQQTVLWGDILAVNEQTIHRIWQEENKTTSVIYHQVSQDGGLSWSAPGTVSAIVAPVSKPILTVTGSGVLHLLQLVTQDTLLFQEWAWTGERWRTLAAGKLDDYRQSKLVSLTAGVASQGSLYALMLFTYENKTGEQISQLVFIDRDLDIGENTQFISNAIISTPNVLSTSDSIFEEVHPTLTSVPPLVNLAEPPPNRSNVINIIVIGVAVVILFVAILPGRKKNRG